MKKIMIYVILGHSLGAALAALPDSAWARLGEAFRKDTLFPRRVEAFRESYSLRAEEEDQALRDAYYRTKAAAGAWYYQRNRYSEAVAELLPIVEDDRPNAEKSFALTMLSLIYTHLGEPERGLALLAEYREQVEAAGPEQGTLSYVEANCRIGAALLRGEAVDSSSVVKLLRVALGDPELSRQVRSYAHFFYLRYSRDVSREQRDSLLAENRRLGVSSLLKGHHYHHSMAAWHEKQQQLDSASYHYARYREAVLNWELPDYFTLHYFDDYARLLARQGDEAGALRLYQEKDSLMHEVDNVLRPQRNALLINRMEAYRNELEKQGLKMRYRGRMNTFLGISLTLSVLLLAAALLQHRKKKLAMLQHSVNLERELGQVRQELRETARSVLLENPNRKAFSDIMQLLSEALAERNLTKMAELKERLSKVPRKHMVDLLYLQDEEYLRRVKQHYPELSATEMRLISLLRQGLSVKDLAQTLSLSYKGAETAKYRLKKKLGIKSKTEWETFLHDLDELPDQQGRSGT